MRFLPNSGSAAVLYACFLSVLSLSACSLIPQKQPAETLLALAENTQQVGSQSDALELYEEAAAAGNGRAQLVVALYQATRQLPNDAGQAVVNLGPGSSPWFETAFVTLEREAAGGQADALVLAGLMHLAGRATQPNSRRASEMLSSASGLGSADAERWLGHIAETEFRYRSAARHYEAAIKRGNTRAYASLGLLLVNGNLDDASYARGMAILRVAQEKGVDTAGSTLHSILESNETQAAQGNIRAIRRLRAMRRTGLKEATLTDTF